MGVFKEAWTRYRRAKQCQRELANAFAEHGVDFMSIDSKTHEKVLREAMATDIAVVVAKWMPMFQAFSQFNQKRNLLRKQTAFLDLAQKIFDCAALSAQPTLESLKKRHGADSKEYQMKFMPVLFEFLYFYLHLANRSAFAQLGPEKSRKLTHQLVAHSIEAITEIQMGHWPEHLREGLKKESFHNYNVAEAGYATCRHILLNPEDRQLTRSMVGQLADNLSEIITGKTNGDIHFQLNILESVVDLLKNNKEDMDALMPKAFAELE